MKIMFVYSVDGVDCSPRPLSSWSKVQFGISYLSSMLKANGHETDLLVLGSGKWGKRAGLIRSHMEKFDPAIVCFTAVFSQYPLIEKAAAFIKRNWPEKFCVVGGVHATLDPETVSKGPFDALCVGEGEYPVLELCSQLEGGQVPHGIANLWFKSPGGEISRTGTRDFIRELDSF
ncbi:MAG: cobalamin-dependent protein, partial [Nitrospiraceae bacterium]|nr:cobalamin-dependent protein [Nitrospiraceae bacterium]